MTSTLLIPHPGGLRPAETRYQENLYRPAEHAVARTAFLGPDVYANRFVPFSAPAFAPFT